MKATFKDATNNGMDAGAQFRAGRRSMMDRALNFMKKAVKEVFEINKINE